MNLLLQQPATAGAYALIDFVALKIIERSHIYTVIFDASNPENLLLLIDALMKNDESKILELGSILFT